ncbi:MAG: hypothetical protein K6B52_03220 [Clostridiales bacterium]|nr:hypothetical protein [Clostridiales bacterium]
MDDLKEKYRKKLCAAIIPPEALKCIEILEKAGFEAYYTGGAVRDIVMGRQPCDYDIATNAKPAETEKVFEKEGARVHETGIKHGTVTAVIGKEPFEITTYRMDGEYSDCRRPDSVRFTSDIANDLSRRDFTCNAIAFSPYRGIVDLFSGMEDIENRLIRCVGDAQCRFKEDGLRILRALRFASCLGFEIEEETKKAIAGNYELLGSISRERIFQELKKLLCGVNAGKILADYAFVFFFLMPELKTLKSGFEGRGNIADIWQRTCKVIDGCECLPHIRFAAMFYAPCSEEEAALPEEKKEVQTVRDILNSLKTSNEFKKSVLDLIANRDIVKRRFGDKDILRFIGVYGPNTVNDLFSLLKSEEAAEKEVKPAGCLSNVESLQQRFEYFVQNGTCFSVKDLAIDGGDVTAAGIKPGPDVKKTLERILDDVLSGTVKNEKSLLMARLREGKYND